MVPISEIDPETRRWAEEMNEIFDRGVKAAKAENARLGLGPASDEGYQLDDEPSQKVAESED